MRLIFAPIALLFLLTSCGQRSAKTESATLGDSTVRTNAVEKTLPDTLCFRQIVGRDSTTLQLVIKDSIVTGELDVIPFEKDRARGSIHGTRTNNQIQADWQRSGEGVTQAYEVVFTLKGDSVIWRDGERVEKEGKWVLKNPAQGYEYVLLKTDCQ
ncbi:hypothetical protein GCM10028808_06150 [Spirosoma migulaei]